MLEQTEAMLMIEPPPASSILGSAADIVFHMARTLRLKLKSQSTSVVSKMLPWWTKPAQLKSTSMRSIDSIRLRTAPSSSTSSRRVLTPSTSW